jgi:flagellar biosynthesis protein FlhB
VTKGKMKQVRQLRMRRRMIAAVPKAAVVITNPTHYAIALEYERGMDAPVCVAKGVDALALKIREVAGEHSVPIVETRRWRARYMLRSKSISRFRRSIIKLWLR